MSNQSEVAFLAGCIGVAGETRPSVLLRAVKEFGPDKILHRPYGTNRNELDTASALFDRLFGAST